MTTGHWQQTFVGMHHAIFECSVGYFQQVPQAAAWSLGGIVNIKFWQLK